MNDSQPDPGTETPLPHDRDEASRPAKEDGQHRHNRAPIEQAHRDVESGLQDTERIGTPTEVPAVGGGTPRRTAD